MPRPKTKQELHDLSQANFKKLMDFVDFFSEEEQNQGFSAGTMNRNIRDVMGHLHAWHLLFLNWYENGMAGKKPDMPAKGYTWKMTKTLNQKIWQDCQKIDLAKTKKLLNHSHKVLQSIIEMHTEMELFKKKFYPWTGSTSLGAYLISATSSHYDWAFKLIKKAKS